MIQLFLYKFRKEALRVFRFVIWDSCRILMIVSRLALSRKSSMLRSFSLRIKNFFEVGVTVANLIRIVAEENQYNPDSLKVWSWQ